MFLQRDIIFCFSYVQYVGTDRVTSRREALETLSSSIPRVLQPPDGVVLYHLRQPVDGMVVSRGDTVNLMCAAQVEDELI